MLNFYNMFILFIIASILGWAIEGIYTYVTRKIILNHSAVVIGPFDFAYGIGAVLLTIALFKFQDSSSLLVFLISFLSGSFCEYIMSLGMEKVFGYPSWDYSCRRFNINGRVCLRYSLFWGILGLAWVEVIYPVMNNYFPIINNYISNSTIHYFIIFLIFDIILTFLAIKRAKDYELGIEPRNGFERRLDKHFGKEYLNKMFNDNFMDKNKYSASNKSKIEITNKKC